MPDESAILAYAPDLASLLLDSLFSSGSAAPGMSVPAREFRLGEAAALLSLCEDSLWNDYGLLPALRDDFLGDELAELGSKVFRPEGLAVRALRDRASQVLKSLRAAVEDSHETIAAAASLSNAAPADFPRTATSRYLEALTKWAGMTSLPEAFRKRLLEGWYARFGAALRSELNLRGGATDELTPSGEERRFDELNRQSWRLDEVLGKLDKWAQINPNVAPAAGKFRAKRESNDGAGSGWTRGLLLAAVLALVAGLFGCVGLWIAFSSSSAVDSIVARIQSRRLGEVEERIVRAAAWMDAEPVPRHVFTTAISVLQDAEDAANPLTLEQLDTALLDLQEKRLCRSTAGGWLFHEQVRQKWRTTDAQGTEWWLRALELLNGAAPAGDSAESVRQWRLLLPHLATLFETVPAKLADGPEMQRLLVALSSGLQASRVEPGRWPVHSFDLPESDELQKRMTVFSESADAYLEKELKNLETKYGRFSREMVVVHRLSAELSWRKKQLKQEQDSWIRAVRALEKQEPRDVQGIAFCDERLGISRAIAANYEGAEEAFAEALKISSEQEVENHPGIGRTERKIARVYAGLGQFDPAWQHHQRAFEALQKAFPRPTPEIAELLEEQGEFLIDHRNFEKGIAVLQRSLEAWKQAEYATSPNLAAAEGVLANAQMLAGLMAEAEQSARIRRDLLSHERGARGPMARQADVDLATILLSKPDPAKAAEAAALMKPWVLILLDAPFADDPETALARCLLARALAQANSSEAIAQFDRGMAVLLRTQPRPSLLVAGCLRDFGQVLLPTDRRLDGLKTLDDASAELSALSRSKPRYLRIATEQIDDLRARIRKARE